MIVGAASNGLIAYRGGSIYDSAWLGGVPAGVWRAVAVGIGKSLALIIAAIVIRMLRRLLVRLAARLKRHDRLKGNDQSVAAVFSGLDRLQANAI